MGHQKTLQCETCGKEFSFYACPSNLRRGRRFCSMKCNTAGGYGRARALTKERLSEIGKLGIAGFWKTKKRAENVDIVYYNDKKFRRYPDSTSQKSRDYWHGPKGESLHREIYTNEVGPIPESWHVHHDDGNTLNNSPGNLICVTVQRHREIHKLRGDCKSEAVTANLNRIRHLTAAWQSTPEATAIKSKAGHKAMATRFAATVPMQCSYCGRIFTPKITSRRSKYCSGLCTQASRRASGIDKVFRSCAKCGKSFLVNKHAKQQHCSHSCASSRPHKPHRKKRSRT